MHSQDATVVHSSAMGDESYTTAEGVSRFFAISQRTAHPRSLARSLTMIVSTMYSASTAAMMNPAVPSVRQ